MGDLHRLHSDGARAWPTIPLTLDQFTETAHGVVEGVDGAPLAADLYLAVALQRSVPAALEVFERELVPRVGAALRRVERDDAVIDEVLQRLRVRALVADGDRPARIASYTGRGALASWMKVAALRLHADLRRETRRAPEPAESPEDLAPASRVDADRALLHARHGATLRRCLADALRALPPRERTLLRLHYLDGLALERVGALYGVHKSTVSRWLTAAREALQSRCVEGVRAHVSAAESAELVSLCAQLCSRLDVSLSALGPDAA